MIKKNKTKSTEITTKTPQEINVNGIVNFNDYCSQRTRFSPKKLVVERSFLACGSISEAE